VDRSAGNWRDLGGPAPKIFAISGRLSQAPDMTKPLALILYEHLLPGSQLVNRLQDLGYRVMTIGNADKLMEEAEAAKPLLILADLACRKGDLCSAIGRLRQNRSTQHIPVLAYANPRSVRLQAAAREAGATLVASNTAILAQLPQLLDQALVVE
jgi:PleD family two-component response regulator